MDKKLKEKLRFKHYWRSLKRNERFIWLFAILLISGIFIVDFDKITIIEKLGLFVSIIGFSMIGMLMYDEVLWEKKVKGEHNEQLGK